MKKLLCITALMLLFSCQEKAKHSNIENGINPFFQEWNTAYEIPPFLHIKDHHYMPAFEKGMKDNQYLDILQKNIEILKKMKLDLILFQAGVDILCEDSLGYLEISRKGIKSRNKIVLEFAKEKNLPLIVFMGGGYSKPIKHSVDSFVDLFIQCSQYATMFN